MRINLLLFFVLFSNVTVFAQVDTAWVRRYNGPSNLSDEARAIAVDSYGNLFVTGYSHDSGSGADFATLKYYPNGDTAWSRRYNGPGNAGDAGFAIAADDSGNAYVTGVSDGGGSSTDYTTLKYYPNGDTAWVRRYNGPGNSDDYASALTVDRFGNVYVTGRSYGSGSGDDYATLKYYPDGDTAWVRRYNGLGNDVDYASAIAVDSSGNVYVTGASSGSGSGWDYVTLKYYPNGDTAWVRKYNGPTSSYDYSRALAIDDSGNVYVTGYSGSSFPAGDDYASIKYNSNGDTAWVRRYNGIGNAGDEAYDLAVDGSGNVYVTGASYGSGTGFDYTTIKYYPNGDTAWVRRYNGPGNSSDLTIALALDDSGNVCVTGYSVGTNLYYEYATIKYHPNGDTAWMRTYNGPPGNSDYLARGLVVDGTGNVYVTGNSMGIGNDRDYVTVKYTECIAKSGDANGDGYVNLSDIVFMVNYIFKDRTKPNPICRGDDTGNGSVNLADIIYKINYIFKGGPKPVKIDVCCL